MEASMKTEIRYGKRIKEARLVRPMSAGAKMDHEAPRERGFVAV